MFAIVEWAVWWLPLIAGRVRNHLISYSVPSIRPHTPEQNHCSAPHASCPSTYTNILMFILIKKRVPWTAPQWHTKHILVHWLTFSIRVWTMRTDDGLLCYYSSPSWDNNLFTTSSSKTAPKCPVWCNFNQTSHRVFILFSLDIWKWGGKLSLLGPSGDSQLCIELVPLICLLQVLYIYDIIYIKIEELYHIVYSRGRQRSITFL